MLERLRDIVARAQTCVKGRDFDGVQSALVEAELELNAVSGQLESAGAGGTEGPVVPESDVSPAEPGAEIENGGGIHPNAEPEPE